MEEIIYFELNNWFSGRDYPDAEPFNTWMEDDLKLKFEDYEWCKENKLCVIMNMIDMSIDFLIAAPKSWVLENCPDLLSDKTYTTTFISCGSEGEKRIEREYGYKQFLCEPDENGIRGSRYVDYLVFPDDFYNPNNFGCRYYDEYEDRWFIPNEEGKFKIQIDTEGNIIGEIE